MNRLILTRHGETVWNIEGRVQGAMDSPLTERGKRQAQELAKRLRSEGVTKIIASDLPRAIATAEIIRADLGISELQIYPAVRELSFGDWEGKVWKELRVDYPETFALWDQGPDRVKIPGGESFHDVSERAWRFIEEIPRRYQAETICVVTHGMTLQMMVKKALGIKVEQWEGVPWQYNTAVNIFDLMDDGVMKPILIADHSHLAALEASVAKAAE